jgi:hypothetical protein
MFIHLSFSYLGSHIVVQARPRATTIEGPKRFANCSTEVMITGTTGLPYFALTEARGVSGSQSSDLDLHDRLYLGSTVRSRRGMAIARSMYACTVLDGPRGPPVEQQNSTGDYPRQARYARLSGVATHPAGARPGQCIIIIDYRRR